MFVTGWAFPDGDGQFRNVLGHITTIVTHAPSPGYAFTSLTTMNVNPRPGWYVQPPPLT